MTPALPLALAALLAAAPAAPPAKAPAPAGDDVAQARSHFDKGARLFRAAKYREAIGEFETAYRLKPHGAIHFNVAQCRERLEEWPGALRSYQDYLREVPDASDRAAVRAAIQKVEQRIAKAGVQALLVYSDPPGAAVRIDGKARGRTPFHTALPPGVYKVGLTLDGFQPEEVEAELTIATSRLVDVVLRSRAAPVAPRSSVDVPLPPPPVLVSPGTAKAPAAAPPATPDKPAPAGTMATGVPGAEAKPAAKLGAELVVKPPEASPLHPPKPPPSGPREKRRVYTWVAAGAAGAALVAAALLGAQASSENEKINDGTVRTTEQIAAIESARDRKAKTANLLYGAAGAAAAAGVTLFIVEGSF